MNRKLDFKIALIKQGLTIKNLAELSGVKAWCIYQYVAGRWNLNSDEKERIAKVVGVSSGELFEE